MANGQKTELQYDFGTCGLCNYTTQEITARYPDGTQGTALEATAMVVHAGDKMFLIVTPHRETCPMHSTQRYS